MKVRVLKNGQVKVKDQQIEVEFDFDKRSYTLDGKTDVHFDEKMHDVGFATLISEMRTHALHFEPNIRLYETLVSYDDGINLFDYERVLLKTKTFEAYVYGKRNKGVFYVKHIFPTDFSEELTNDFVEDGNVVTFLTKKILKNFEEKDPKFKNENKIKFAGKNLTHVEFQEFAKEMEERYQKLTSEISDSKISEVKYGDLPSGYDEWVKSVFSLSDFLIQITKNYEKEKQNLYIQYCKNLGIKQYFNQHDVLAIEISVDSSALKTKAFLIPEKRIIVARYYGSDNLVVREYDNNNFYDFMWTSAGSAFSKMTTIHELSNIEDNIEEIMIMI